MNEILRLIARNSRINVLKMTNRSKASHVGSSLSCIDILVTLYSKYKEQVVNCASEIDTILVSKGHAAAAVYAILAELQLIDSSLIEKYCMNGSTLGGHVSHSASSHIPLSTGSLGHALPFGVGVAISKKKNGDKSLVNVVISDGECDEGSNWEAALVASAFKLDNLRVYIDRNYLQSLESTESTIPLEPLGSKWRSFGWEVQHLNGHDLDLLQKSSQMKFELPTVFICDTVKGYGVSFMQNKVEWHYKSPNDFELEQAIIEVKGSTN